MASTSESTVARIQLARENEELVIAEAALESFRIVAWARLALICLYALSQNVIPRLVANAHVAQDPVRTGLGAAFILYSAGTVVGLRRATPSVGPAKFWSPVSIVIDYAFMTAMGMRAYAFDGHALPEISAITYAVLLCFSFGRYNTFQVVLATALSCASYVMVTTYNHSGTPMGAAFTCGSYIGLAVLVVRTNLRLRDDFLGLRRRDNLTRFLSPQVAERVMRLEETALAPAQREVTVMFTDIRDFTSLSELMPPGEVLAFLDEYFGHMGSLVKAHDGVVNKFLGDGMLALWGAPDPRPDHAVLAIRAALDMRTTLQELNQVRAQRHQAPIRFGIGIHSGTVAAGMLGGVELSEYTVIGDAVNLASRIEGLTKRAGVDLLVSEATWSQVESEFIGRKLGAEFVPGRAESVVVYAIEGRRPNAQQALSLAPTGSGA